MLFAVHVHFLCFLCRIKFASLLLQPDGFVAGTSGTLLVCNNCSDTFHLTVNPINALWRTQSVTRGTRNVSVRIDYFPSDLISALYGFPVFLNRRSPVTYVARRT